MITKQQFIKKVKLNLKKAGFDDFLYEDQIAPCDCDWKKCPKWQVVNFTPSYPLPILKNIKITIDK